MGKAAPRWLNMLVVVLLPPLWLYAGYKLTRHPIDLHGRGFLDCITMFIVEPLAFWASLKELRRRDDPSLEHKQQ